MVETRDLESERGDFFYVSSNTIYVILIITFISIQHFSYFYWILYTNQVAKFI